MSYDIKHFVDTVILPNANPLPDVPEEYRGEWSSDDGWYEWKAVDSPVTEDELGELENQYSVILPSLLKEYFLYKQILDGDIEQIRLPDMAVSAPLKGLDDLLSMHEEYPLLKEKKLFPFAYDGNDGGLMCFMSSEEVDKSPIYFVDHSYLNKTDHQPQAEWISFSHMLQSIEEKVKSYGD